MGVVLVLWAFNINKGIKSIIDFCQNYKQGANLASCVTNLAPEFQHEHIDLLTLWLSMPLENNEDKWYVRPNMLQHYTICVIVHFVFH